MLAWPILYIAEVHLVQAFVMFLRTVETIRCFDNLWKGVLDLKVVNFSSYCGRVNLHIM